MKQISLKAARVNAGLSQMDVAKMLQISKATLVAWENGKTKIKPVYFNAICRLYGFEPEEIFLPKVLT